MLFNNKYKLHLSSILFISSLLLFTGCDDDPIKHEEEHFEAIGTVIYDASGAIAVSILRGETTDTLFATAGELSDHFEVKFYDEDENIIDPPDEDHQSLVYEIKDESIATGWQHPGEEGGFEFHIQGIKSGITTIELFIQHEGHNDYRSGLIPLKIVAE